MDLETIIRKKCDGFETLDFDMCVCFVTYASALSIEECYDYLLIDESELSQAEKDFSQRLHRRGRAIGVKDACDNLFMHMKTRAGGQSAIEYLTKVSSEFGMTAHKTSAGGFQFQIVLPPEEAE